MWVFVKWLGNVQRKVLCSRTLCTHMSYGNRHWEEQGRSSGQWYVMLLLHSMSSLARAQGQAECQVPSSRKPDPARAEAEAGKLEHWMSTPSRVMAYLELGGMFQDKRSSVLTRDTEKHVIRGV